MNRLRYWTIWFLDWVVDVRILHHRFPRYCFWLAWHPWWKYGPKGETTLLDGTEPRE